MKFHVYTVLGILVACATSCDRDTQPPTSTPLRSKSGERTPDELTAKFSLEVLPESAAPYSKPPGPGDTPIAIAHDTPPLDRRVRGPYSYLGAAREFQAICGFSPPDWVEAIKGSYGVQPSNGKFVCLADLEYKIDPGKTEELAALIMKAHAKRWPSEKSLVWSTGKGVPEGPEFKIAYVDIKMGEDFLFHVTIRIHPDGRVFLFNNRGPENWER